MNSTPSILLALFMGALVAILAIPYPAKAQSSSRCAERQMVLERLGGKYGETRQSIGLAANNSIVEMFASNESGTWTITVTHPNGMTCMVAAGTAFEDTSDEIIPNGDPA